MSAENCKTCVGEYFVGWEHLMPAQKYPDPECPASTPWCPLYEAILKRVGREMPSTAAYLAGIRAKMKHEMEQGTVRQQPKPAWRPNQLPDEPGCPICYGPMVDGQCWRKCK